MLCARHAKNSFPRVAQAGLARAVVSALGELLLRLGLQDAVIYRVVGYVQIARFQHANLKFHNTEALVDRSKLQVLRVAHLLHCDTGCLTVKTDDDRFTGSGGIWFLLRVYQIPVGVTVFVYGRRRQRATEEQYRAQCKG